MEIQKTGFIPATIYWIFAHPDDETICAGRSLIQHREHNNIVVIMTDGSKSGVRHTLGLTPTEFIQARQRECLAAVAQVGVREVIFAGYQDGELQKSDVYAFVKELMQKNSKARVKTHTARENPYHRDHFAVASGISDLYKQKIITDLREYAIVHFSEGEILANSFKPVNQKLDGIMKTKMVNEYFLIDEENGRYGIGGQSVPVILRNSVIMSEAILKPE